MAFNKGDEVQHKSGGPKMIVEGDHAFGAGVVCSWWDNKAKKFNQDSFPEEVLRPYQAPQGGLPFVSNPRPPRF